MWAMSDARPSIDAVTRSLLDSYRELPNLAHIDAGPLPTRVQVVELVELLRNLIFPGYFCPQPLSHASIASHAAGLLAEVRSRMEQLVGLALRFVARHKGDPDIDHTPRAQHITDAFMARLPELRRLLSLDVQAAYEGDPAAVHTDETIFCYPGIDAIFTYRVAHELHLMGVRLLPRMMTEQVHNDTGIDIHPGATIGESFFIDHGTGVVIGETTHIGNRCKLYQGVTLGAMSFPRDEEGRLIRGTKRHPTLEDGVTIYANATILGGTTIVGAGCIVGGSVFLTKSVPPGHYVTLKTQELRYRSAAMHDRLVIQPRSAEA
jgi:serine O-acetyltransferase